MNDEVPVGVRNGLTDLLEDAHPRIQVEGLSGSELDDGLTLGKLHNQIRPSIFCRAGLEKTSDVRMVEPRQNLPLISEASQHFVRVHATLYEL